MPEQLERKLKSEAHDKGFKTGSKRYNAYVYGTLNKLGVLNSNHAGALAPEGILMKLTYNSTHPNVRGVHIGIVVALLFVIGWFMTKGKLNPQPGAQNGDGASQYLNTADYTGWVQYQYNDLGAQAGALTGESN